MQNPIQLAPPAPPQRPAFVVVLDPGHGGADNGARGASGIVEKDLALAIARATRIQLLQQGLKVVMTRDSDDNPPFDDRATLANSQRSSLLVSFHVATTGKNRQRAHVLLFIRRADSGSFHRRRLRVAAAREPLDSMGSRAGKFRGFEPSPRRPGTGRVAEEFSELAGNAVGDSFARFTLGRGAGGGCRVIQRRGGESQRAGQHDHAAGIERGAWRGQLSRGGGDALMSRNIKITLAILGVAVVIGLLSLRGLHERVTRLAHDQATEEQARRAVVSAPITTPTDAPSNATIFWAASSSSAQGQLEASQIQLQLSSDAAMRGKQVIQALIQNAPSATQRTLPADVRLLAFYVLPDGTAIADFSDELSVETPSGILSEELAVNSIARTLEANIPTLRRLHILIHGQGADTLAGHVDLTGNFDLHGAP